MMHALCLRICNAKPKLHSFHILPSFFHFEKIKNPIIGRPVTYLRKHPWILEEFSGEVASHYNDHSKIQRLEWNSEMKRIGTLGLKLGMSTHFDKWGRAIPVTIVHIFDCRVLGSQPIVERPGFSRVQMAIGRKSAKRLHLRYRKLYEHFNVPPKQHLDEFVVSNECILPPGWSMNALHFLPGQNVDIKGRSIGKGFQGVMKRWGFKGLPATHGVTKKHRSGGSIGCHNIPGRVLKNKKMAGRMGNEKITVFNSIVLKIDVATNCLYIKGSVPGHTNSVLHIRDSMGCPLFVKNPPPVPTFIPKDNETPIERFYEAPEDNFDPLGPKVEVLSK